MKTKRAAQCSHTKFCGWTCCILVCAASVCSRADTIIVTNLNDSGAGSLRQALTDATDGDTINVAVTGTISLKTGELVIDKNVTISGPGSNSLTVRPSSGSFFRVFDVMSSHSITIQGLTISFGYAEFAQGGGIFL